jgi:hypothetical protein
VGESLMCTMYNGGRALARKCGGRFWARCLVSILGASSYSSLLAASSLQGDLHACM